MQPVSQLLLTQEEADALLQLEKHRADERSYQYPGVAEEIRIPLVSADRREEFVLDIHRSRFDLVKGTYQNRARTIVQLARLDFGGRPHRNPDDQEIDCPHLHVYRAGYGISFAYPLDPSSFPNPTDRWELLVDFMRYVRITMAPTIERGLFV